MLRLLYSTRYRTLLDSESSGDEENYYKR